MLPLALSAHIENLLQTKIAEAQPVSGGSINLAYRLRLADGRHFFLKTNTSAHAPAMFRAEQLGLAMLGASQVIRVPKVLAHGLPESCSSAFLLMEYIAPGWKNRLFWEKFGISLANLHGNASQWFGFSHDNFIGSLPQGNQRHEKWEDFYHEERLLPQMIVAYDAGLLTANDAERMDTLCRKLCFLCPKESPALIHGDLWTGNFLCDAQGEAVLIDPAACFAHREMDLAMTHLFGGFDPVFYQSYEAAWPLEKGFEKRMEIYQLYYLMVHVNLFGGGYVAQVQNILKRFG
jgi:fructosamine-3-kinase